MDSPSAPPPPDPYKVADAQSQYNINAARTTAQLGRYNQVTPYGNLTWSHSGASPTGVTGTSTAAPAPATTTTGGTTATGGGNLPYEGLNGGGNNGYDAGNNSGGATGTTGTTGTTGGTTGNDGYNSQDDWTSTITLDPRVQGLLDSYLKTSQGLEDSTQNALGQVNDAFKTPIDYAHLPAAGSASGALAAASAQQVPLTNQIHNAQGLTGQAQGLAGTAMSQWQNGMHPLDFSGVSPMWQPGDATRQQVQDNLYSQYTRTLDPQYQQEQKQLADTLANRGIPEGSPAWQTAMDQFARSKNDAYNQAQTSAITGTTNQMEALSREGLAARQQGVGEAKDLWNAPQQQALNALAASGQAGGQLTNLTDASNRQQAQETSSANTMFNMQNAERGNALSEQIQQKSLPLQWLASLRSGTAPPMPQFQSPSGPTVQPANYGGYAYNSYDGAMKQYGADVGSNNSMMAGGASIMGAIIAAM